MSLAVRVMATLPALALVASLTGHVPAVAQGPDSDVGDPNRATPSVIIFDNDAPGMGFHRDQGFWGFGPYHVEARRGATVTFYNPDSNHHPHTVTSLERVGSPFDNQVRVGARFDSSPNQGALIAPDGTFKLDTSTLAPGQYPYFCKLHPWMTGFVTVLPGPRQR